MIELGFAADLATAVDYTLFADVFADGIGPVLESRNGGGGGGNPCTGYALDPICNIGEI